MSKEQLVDRMLARESGVDAWSLRTGNLTMLTLKKSAALWALLAKPRFILMNPGITVSDLRTIARREAHQHQVGLIIVDYCS